MAVDLHSGDLMLLSQLLSDKNQDILSDHQNHPSNKKGSGLILPPGCDQYPFSSNILLTGEERKDKKKKEEDNFIAELALQMAHYMFQDDDHLAFSKKSETLWSTKESMQRIPEGKGKGKDPDSSSYDTMRKLEMISLNNEGSSKCNHGHGIQGLENPNLGFSSNQTGLTHEQIQTIQFFRLKQEQILKQKARACWEKQTQQPRHQYESREFNKKGEVSDFGTNYNNRRKLRSQALSSQSARPSPQLQHQQVGGGSGMKAVFLGGSGSRTGSCGTGVFFPRGTGTSTESAPKKRGSSTVLIPARVVQALQLHFDQMGITSGTKAGGFPPLHDVLVSTNRDGMYSLQKRHSKKGPLNTNNPNDQLPQEWTY